MNTTPAHTHYNCAIASRRIRDTGTGGHTDTYTSDIADCSRAENGHMSYRAITKRDAKKNTTLPWVGHIAGRDGGWIELQDVGAAGRDKLP